MLRAKWIGLVAMIVSFCCQAPAIAWNNGIEGPNSYGGHDWVLKQAIDAVGNEGSWIRERVALRATDDPDTKAGIDHASGRWWHSYDEWGDTHGGAPEAAQVWFRRIKRRLEAGNERAASKALGYLAHIVGDVAQPMHTDQRDRELDVHSDYETETDQRLDSYGFDYDGQQRARPYRRVVEMARDGHEYYFALVGGYDRNGYSDRVHRITSRQLQRAANEMADLIASL